MKLTSEKNPSIYLKTGRDRPLRRGHPWVFASAIQDVRGDPGRGETVDVYSHADEFLARGAYSPDSKIRVRVWTQDEQESVDRGFFQARISNAISARDTLRADPALSAYREVYAESDLLPGLIVDRYGDYRVVQFLSAGAEHFRDVIVEVLHSAGDCSGIYERSDADVRSLEGLMKKTGVLWGEEPDGLIEIDEYRMRFLVDAVNGHKTGFYLDQRENRRSVGRFFQGGEVLDCFCYTGSFSAAALRSGADRVIAIESSRSAVTLAEKTIQLNGLSLDRFSALTGDVFFELRSFRDSGRSFDAIILDPPRFAPTTAHISKASRGYKDINLLAFKLLKPGGLLFTFSCSGGVSPALFQKIVSGAAHDAHVQVQVLEQLGQPADHPVHLNFPEGRYLKGLICRVMPA